MTQNLHQSYTPGSRIGILGSGQLGQMMTIAAKKLGYYVVIYDAVPGPATSCADLAITAPFNDQKALRRFVDHVDLITLEFENIPLTTLEQLSSQRTFYPAPEVIRICQDRILEKEFLSSRGFPIAPFFKITSAEELSKALATLDSNAILKTATLGYDGKGQCHLHPDDDTMQAWTSLKTDRAVLEQKIDFVGEASVICARSPNGETLCFPMQENIHRHGILHQSIIPARFEKETARQAEEIGRAITEKLNVIGLLTIEFFVLPDGSLMVNELAPRPHNSGHHTLESSKTSQFEQIIRAVCGLPLGSSERKHAAIMVNLLGDLWSHGEPDWSELLKREHVYLHLYGKKEAKLGRKMGHFTIIGNDQKALIKLAQSLFEGLLAGGGC